LQKRALGKTGLELSVIGVGGFHLLEIGRSDVEKILGTYLDRGGNYIETAAGYGAGQSEKKIGATVSHRRDEYVLATKAGARTRAEYLELVEQSLRNLRTDHLDIVFMHGVQSPQEADQIVGSGGALEGALQAREAGKIRLIGITGHGRPHSLIRAMKGYDYDVLMTGFNYYDRFNWPEGEEELIPLCRAKGTGLLVMKSVGDGYLYKSFEPALRYALGLPAACVVLGMNTMEQLEEDFRIAESCQPMSDTEKEELYRTAPELGDYVCRLCGQCANGDGFDPQTVFRLEGLYDRQMDDKRLTDTAQYALRERLKFWFRQNELAREEYAALRQKVDPQADYSQLNAKCPYGIDIDRKLKIAHSKLSDSGYIF
jgi:predicted aldo/keto reductase-like oxidoreductase